MMPDLLRQLDLIPPCIARLCARDGLRMVSLRAIHLRSGLDMDKVIWISRQGSWKKVTVEDAMLFAMACGIDPLRPRKKLFYLRRAMAAGGKFLLGKGRRRAYAMRQLRLWQAHHERDKAAGGRRAGSKGR